MKWHNFENKRILGYGAGRAGTAARISKPGNTLSFLALDADGC
jgi:hypothetical protein